MFLQKKKPIDWRCDMPNLEYSLPYSDNPETLDEILEISRRSSNKIREVYLSGSQLYSGSGRVMPEISEEKFIDVMGRITLFPEIVYIMAKEVTEKDEDGCQL